MKFKVGDRVVMASTHKFKGEIATAGYYGDPVPVGTYGTVKKVFSNYNPGPVVDVHWTQEAGEIWMVSVDIGCLAFDMPPTEEELAEVMRSLAQTHTPGGDMAKKKQKLEVNKVFILQKVWPHDGNEIIGVYASLESAQKDRGPWKTEIVESETVWTSTRGSEYDEFLHIHTERLQP